MQMENNSEDMDNIIKHVDHIRLDVAVTGGSRRHVIPIWPRDMSSLDGWLFIWIPVKTQFAY